MTPIKFGATQRIPLFFLKDRWLGFSIAIGLHAAALLGGGLGFIEKAEFGMGSSESGYAVDLVAALPEREEIEPLRISQKESENLPAMTNDDLLMQDVKTQLQDEPKSLDEKIENRLQVAETSQPVGDGSSPIPGNDTITVRAGEGWYAHTKPGYYRNSPLFYPEQARLQGQQGLVVLYVLVSEKGRTKSVELKKSSGFYLLDEAAISAVKGWKFKPARLKGIYMDSLTEIPIRFKLDE